MAAHCSACELPASGHPPAGLTRELASTLREHGPASCRAALLLPGSNNPRPQEREGFREPFLISVCSFSSPFKMTVPLTSPLGKGNNSKK